MMHAKILGICAIFHLLSLGVCRRVCVRVDPQLNSQFPTPPPRKLKFI